MDAQKAGSAFYMPTCLQAITIAPPQYGSFGGRGSVFGSVASCVGNLVGVGEELLKMLVITTSKKRWGREGRGGVTACSSPGYTGVANILLPYCISTTGETG